MNRKKRHWLFVLSVIAFFPIFYSPIAQVIKLSFRDALYSHVPMIPILSGLFLFVRRKSIFSEVRYSVIWGMAFVCMGALFFIAGSLRVANLNENDHLSLLISSGLTIYMGIFILFYGPQAFKRAMFPLLLLVCMAPVPSFIVRTFEQLLQSGSAETVGAIFWLLGLEVNRSGYAFHFPHLTVEIWESCTGIRASIALVITSVIAANLFLSKGWTKVLAVILSIPISILKNSFRIVIISIIGAYVDESVFDSALHSTEGGAFFFIGALLLVWLVIIALGRIEKWKTKPWSMFSAVR